MRLYLSSFRMGGHPDHLAALVGESGRRAVVIANALDDAPADQRARYRDRVTARRDPGPARHRRREYSLLVHHVRM